MKANAWMVDSLDDIASDLSAIHRVNDWRALDGPTYFALALRLWAYPGIIRARALAEEPTESRAFDDRRAPAGERVQHVSDGVMLADLEVSGWAEKG